HTRFSRDWSSDVCSSDLVHWTLDGLRLSRDDAAQIAYEVSKEIGGTIPHHDVWGEGKDRSAWVETEKENVSFAIFYQPSSYHMRSEERRGGKRWRVSS